MTTAAILWVLYWGSDGRSAMTAHEYTSMDRCEAAKALVAKTMDSSYQMFGNKTYAVCTLK